MLWSHSFKLHKVKTNLRRVYDLLAIFNISWYCENMQFWHIMLRKKWSPAGLRYLASAVALLHFSSHWLPGDREFRALPFGRIPSICSHYKISLKRQTLKESHISHSSVSNGSFCILEALNSVIMVLELAEFMYGQHHTQSFVSVLHNNPNSRQNLNDLDHPALISLKYHRSTLSYHCNSQTHTCIMLTADCFIY